MSSILLNMLISIHAPAGGATNTSIVIPILQPISIHAPAGGATDEHLDQLPKLLISIHAPAGGATPNFKLFAEIKRFQSTRLREARPFWQ